MNKLLSVTLYDILVKLQKIRIDKNEPYEAFSTKALLRVLECHRLFC